MRSYFAVRLVAEYNHVLKAARPQGLAWVARVPDARLAHEIKARLMRDGRPCGLRIRPEEDRCTKAPLEGSDQPPILRSPLLHAKHIQHFCSATESNRLFLLPHGKRGEENGNQPILSPGNAVVGVSDHLQNELTIPPLV